MPGTSDFGTFGRYTELSLDEMTADQKRVYEFTVKQRGEVPGPYKIWLQNPKLIEVMVPLGAYYQGHSSLSKAEIEIATNLTNAKWLGASGRGPTKVLSMLKRRCRARGRRPALQGLWFGNVRAADHDNLVEALIFKGAVRARYHPTRPAAAPLVIVLASPAKTSVDPDSW
jgi:hypothetical protein